MLHAHPGHPDHDPGQLAMVLTGKQALDFSGGVSADDNFGIGGYDRVMGPNGQAQYWAPSLADACALLLHHYELHVRDARRAVPAPDRRRPTPLDRDVRPFPHAAVPDCDFTRRRRHLLCRAQPRAQAALRHALGDARGHRPATASRWSAGRRWREGDNSVVWDTRIGGIPVSACSAWSRDPIARQGFVPGRRPAVVDLGHAVPAVLAQDRARRQRRERQPAAGRAGEPVGLRRVAGVDAALAAGVRRRDRPCGHQLQGPDRVRRRLALPRRCVRGVLQGAERRDGDRGRRGLVRVGDRRRAGGGHGVRPRGQAAHRRRSPRASRRKKRWPAPRAPRRPSGARALAEITEQVRSEKLGEVAGEFDAIHTIERALRVGSVDRIISAARPAALRGRRPRARHGQGGVAARRFRGQSASGWCHPRVDGFGRRQVGRAGQRAVAGRPGPRRRPW